MVTTGVISGQAGSNVLLDVDMTVFVRGVWLTVGLSSSLAAVDRSEVDNQQAARGKHRVPEVCFYIDIARVMSRVQGIIIDNSKHLTIIYFLLRHNAP